MRSKKLYRMEFAMFVSQKWTELPAFFVAPSIPTTFPEVM